jgi:thioredoxin reductase
MRGEYDLVVVGAGPAGMAGAVSSAERGLSVLLVDEQAAPGGQIWRGVDRNDESNLSQALGDDYRKGAQLTRSLRDSAVETCFNAKVWQVEDQFKVFLSVGGRARIVNSKAILLATGAQERPNPFPGWNLPGVMTVGAGQILMKNGGSIPSKPVWIAGTGPLPLLYMKQLLDLGGAVAGYIDTAPASNLRTSLPLLPRALSAPKNLVKGAAWLAKLRRAGLPFYRASNGLEAVGSDMLEAVRFKTAHKQTLEFPTDLLLTHEGVVPSVHFSMALGCEHEWDPAQLCFFPRLNSWGESSRAGIFVAGDGSGIAGADAAVQLGIISGIGIATKLGVISEQTALASAASSRRKLRRLLSMRPFLDALYRPRPEVFFPSDDTLVCRCECKTAGEIRAVAKKCGADPAIVKTATRAGMGPCQGRQCGYTIAALIAEAQHAPQGSVGFLNIRPPLKPVTLGEMANLSFGETSNDETTPYSQTSRRSK